MMMGNREVGTWLPLEKEAIKKQAWSAQDDVDVFLSDSKGSIEKMRVLVDQMTEDWSEYADEIEAAPEDSVGVYVKMAMMKLSQRHEVYLDLMSEILMNQSNELEQAKLNNSKLQKLQKMDASL
ncbi:hypothetical protein [Jeotgalibaca sp. PTS2502]|uniref:hypothetical protein n=1 Tax=Jeotgalibaca sp. PTS2502 TaxID=1903686 RepID=UPI0012EB751F|nr:hypothetical protein [Jeotgalibaca sp. PTS2502]